MAVPLFPSSRVQRAHECDEVSEKAACERKNGLPLPSRPPPSSVQCCGAMNIKKKSKGGLGVARVYIENMARCVFVFNGQVVL